jgi:hypothetical protein
MIVKPVTIFSFVMLVLSGTANADSSPKSSHPQLHALSECPENEPTCIVFNANFSWPGKRSDNPLDHPSVVAIDMDNKTGYGTAFIIVHGRLNKGSVRKYRVGLPYPGDQLNCNDSSVAVAGVSGETGGTVFTDKGRLQIIDDALSFGSHSTLRLIHKKTMARTNHISPGWEKNSWKATPIIRADGRVLWRVRDYCLDLESQETFTRLPEQECSGGKLLSAEQADIDKIFDSQVFESRYANERLKTDLWRLEGSPFLVYVWGVACT